MLETLSNKQQNEKVKQQTIELYELEQKFKNIKSQYEAKKEGLARDISNFLFCNKGFDNGFSFLAQTGNTFSRDNKQLKLSKITPTKIVWDAKRLEDNLSEEQAAKVIQKQYEINDVNGLIRYLKSCGVNPKVFKSFVSVSRTVNKEALEQLDKLGELKPDDIKGCYELNKSSSYLKVSIMEDES